MALEVRATIAYRIDPIRGIVIESVSLCFPSGEQRDVEPANASIIPSNTVWPIELVRGMEPVYIFQDAEQSECTN